MAFTRGFRGRQPDGGVPQNRVPPGQYITHFPVVSAGSTQQTRLENWSFGLRQGADVLASWNWTEFEALPQTMQTVDIHCVTKWSKLGTRWRGVTFDDLIKAAGLAAPPEPYVMAHCDDGYTTNLPVADLLGGKAMMVTHLEGAPLASVHGGPARLLVPHLYFWKSAKWVRSLVFMKTNDPGFWESRGYHISGDPWWEQRYTGDE